MRTGEMLLGMLLLGATGLAGQEGWTRAADDRCDEWNADRERACEMRTRTLPATGTLEVDAGRNGGIAVTAWDGSEVEVVARVRATARTAAGADALLDEVRLLVDGDRLSVRGPRTERREGWHVNWEIRVPRTYDLRLEATNGGLSVADVFGSMDLSTTNGGIRLENPGGDVRGRTVNGGTRVTLEGRSWQGRGLDLQTTNGGIDLRVPEGYSAELETGTTNGSFDIDFPMTVQGRIGRRLETTLGTGGPPLRLTTTNGGVRVRRP